MRTVDYYHADRPRYQAVQKVYRDEHKSEKRELNAAYAAANPAAKAAHDAVRRQAKRKRVGWCDMALVRDIYELARIWREAGISCHVDHIVPLKSKLVSGLHVQGNLSVILAEQNMSKGNRVWPDMP